MCPYRVIMGPTENHDIAAQTITELPTLFYTWQKQSVRLGMPFARRKLDQKWEALKNNTHPTKSLSYTAL